MSATPKTDSHIVRQREDRETGRRTAAEYAPEMLLINVHLARTSVDENIILRASKAVMDRAWGNTKPATEEEKKGADAGSILDVLAAMSRQAGIAESRPLDAPAIEHEPQTPENSLESFLDELNGADDDAEDAELVE